MALLSFSDVSLAYGLNPLLDKVSFQLDRGERVCLIGRNGAGKSSLFRLVTGEQGADEGDIWFAPGLKIGQLPQELPAADDKTVYDVVASGLAGVGELLAEYHHLITGDMGDAELARLEKVQVQLEAKDGWRLDQLVDTTLTRLGLPADKQMSELSGGWRRRVLLAQALVAEPDVLLLDEPLNGTDPRQRIQFQALLHRLADEGRTILISSHILEEVEQLADTVLLIVAGKLAASGDYRAIRAKLNEQPYHVKIVSDKPRELASRIVGMEAMDAVNVDSEGALTVLTRDLLRLQRELPQLAQAGNIRLLRVEPLDDSLESVFGYLVAG